MTATQEPRPPTRPFRLAALRRRGWIVPLAMACAALAAYLIASNQPEIYTAESVVVVDSGADRTGPGQANDATTLARTYAGAIREDQRTLRRVAGATDRTVDEVEKDVTVFTDTGTSLLRLQYRDEFRRRAITGARSLANGVLDAPRESPVNRSSLRLVSEANDATRSAGDVGRAVPIGLVLGAALGLLLLLAWERSHPRIDDPDDLRAVFGGGVTDARRFTPAALSALAARWRELAGRGDPLVGLLPSGRRARRSVRALDEALAAAVPALRTERGGAPGAIDAGEELAMRSDLSVLVVRRGARVSELRRALETLDQLDHAPGWAVLTGARGPRLRGAEDGAAPVAAGDEASLPGAELGDRAGPRASRDDGDPRDGGDARKAAEDERNGERLAVPRPARDPVGQRR